MNEEQELEPLSAEELAAEGITALPAKEVASILDLNADLNLGIQAAAPIDLGVAANANVAAPIDASASANVLSAGSTAAGVAHQGALIDQGINADATANSTQDSSIGHTAPPAAAAPAPAAPAGGTVTDPTAAVNGNLLNVDVKLDANAGIAAPINGAVAANANVAAPINAGVAANIGAIDSNAVAAAQQDAVINQHIDGAATATSNQHSTLQQ
ncbi:peptidoglycan-binding protein [Arthrobacter bambusae]|uniref:peptidoglycan-binding protein n=1 Tax=Arthrobacter TaxID=1663 RepID=UPI001F50F0B0|nr:MULTISPECIES: peptidoglycan-binding protein [Arthrobacter]MCI0144216.1 peptidoglycan-binding protein [Arthrobacter bambusae]UYY83135.1 peptidoglycan-binding protein [Arthrobacter sp. YA7-1]